MKQVFTIGGLLIAIGLSGCLSRINTSPETVVSLGMTIGLHDGGHDIQISSLGDSRRSIIVDGYTNVVKLTPRRSRSYGNKGLSGSGGWRAQNDINRVIVSEGQQHFSSAVEAVFWLNFGWNGPEGINLAYTPNGLAVGYKETTVRKQVNIDIWQIYVDGKKPDSLDGADPDSIQVSSNNSISSEPEAGSFEPSKPRTVNGISYSGRALDMMKEDKKISFADVEQALHDGTSQNYNGVVVHELAKPAGGFALRVVVDSTGTVQQIYSGY